MAQMPEINIFYFQFLGICAIGLVTQSIHFENNDWLVKMAQYIVCIQLVSGMKEICVLVYKIKIESMKNVDAFKTIHKAKLQIGLFIISMGILIHHKKLLETEHCFLITVAYLLIKYLEVDKKSSVITYGCGMACSYFEGYLKHVIPSDGHTLTSFYDKVNKYEQKHGQNVVFPVKKLFIVITKSLYCPPDLTMFNKDNRKDLPILESCQSLDSTVKDVAGVKNRKYSNSVYMIRRPKEHAIFLSVECATPLHTLKLVVDNHELYKELRNINVEEVVDDFCYTLRTIVSTSKACQNRCQLVFFDDEDPSQNLANVLIDKIREIEPDFESITTNS